MNNKSISKSPPNVRTALGIFYALPVLFALGIFGFLFWQRATHQGPPVRHVSGMPFNSIPIGGLMAKFFTDGPQLRAAGDDVIIEFRDSKHQLADVGDVTFELALKSPDFVMHSIGKVLRTSTTGQYRTTMNPQMAGVWTATVSYSGPRGKGEASFSTTVAK